MKGTEPERNIKEWARNDDDVLGTLLFTRKTLLVTATIPTNLQQRTQLLKSVAF